MYDGQNCAISIENENDRINSEPVVEDRIENWGISIYDAFDLTCQTYSLAQSNGSILDHQKLHITAVQETPNMECSLFGVHIISSAHPISNAHNFELAQF